MIIAEYEGEAISTLLIVPFGETVLTKIIGWSGHFAKFRPNEAVYWAAIEWAKSSDFHYFDMEGINPIVAKKILSGKPLPEFSLQGPDFFKVGFGGQVVLYPEAYGLLDNPILSWAYQKAYPKLHNHDIANRVMDLLRKLY